MTNESDYIRDNNSNALINTNKVGLEKRLAQREQARRLSNLETNVKGLTEQVQLLTDILEKHFK